jgi:hypothetical protein
MATNTAKAQAAFDSAAEGANRGLTKTGQAINSVTWGDYSYVFPAFLFGLSAYVLLATIKIFYGLRDDCENETLIRTVYTLSVVSSFLTGWLGTILVITDSVLMKGNDGKLTDAVKALLVLTAIVITGVFGMSCSVLAEIQKDEKGKPCNPTKDDDGEEKTTVQKWAASLVGITTPLFIGVLIFAGMYLSGYVKPATGVPGVASAPVAA